MVKEQPLQSNSNLYFQLINLLQVKAKLSLSWFLDPEPTFSGHCIKGLLLTSQTTPTYLPSFFFVFTGKAESQRGETERASNSLIHFPNGHNRMQLDQSEIRRASSLLEVSHMGAGVPGPEPSFTVFPGLQQGTGS